jgi:hypothetical protein
MTSVEDILDRHSETPRADTEADREARLLIQHYCKQIAHNILDVGMGESHFQSLCGRPLKRINELMDQLRRKK